MTDEPALSFNEPSPRSGAQSAEYRVLARKYRPQTFADMIGQEALVRTLTNAIASGRLAHAFILTGVRGVGKTTTARIIARALNCVGPDGKGGPTPEPCGVCEPCRAIASDRMIDVVEMDAASNNGVEEVREIIDAVRYAPAAARYKVWILDEVHMLSKAAFNALLKTLEEPPPHVKFIFATTEIRKVPVTILSRCQRFDLRRIEADELTRYFHGICVREQVEAEDEAIRLIARAADGSARDGLSILDQAIAQASFGGGPVQISADQVRDMLGLADRTRVIDLFEAAMKGDGPGVLEILGDMHARGADPIVVLQDLLDLVHFLTRIRLVPALAESGAEPEAERRRGGALAKQLSMPVLTRSWQMLLKGLAEVQDAPSPADALEMVLIRLVYAASLPTPGEVVRKIEAGEFGALPPAASGPAQPLPNGGGGSGATARSGLAIAASAPEPSVRPSAKAEAQPRIASALPESFADLVAYVGERDVVLHAQLWSAVHLVRYEPGRLEFRPTPEAPADLANRLGSALRTWTGQRWMVSVSSEPGAETLAEADRRSRNEAIGAAASHPLVRAVLDAFPGSVIRDVRNPLEAPGTDSEAGEVEPIATDDHVPGFDDEFDS